MNCPRCFAALAPDAPQGLCPKCLLAVGMGEPEVILTASGEPAPPPPAPEAIQPHFPQLEIVKLIGRGGMGAVYEARQRGLARTVALKVLAAPAGVDASFEERFVREAQALARLSHENIVAVYDAGRAGPHFYLLLEHVDGPNLRQALRAGRIAPEQALAIVMQICSALEFAHRQGVVHRDIKPENVLLTREGRVKIADFGLAKVLDRAVAGQHLTRASQAMGTPHYMAPEQIEHPQQVDHRADIYSLGVVLYELLTGELPLGRFPLPSQKVQIDVRLDDIVVRTLEKEPERRYQAASEVRSAVQHVATTPPPIGAPVAAAVGSAAAASAAPRRRVWPWVAVGLVVLAMVLTVPLAIAVLLVYGTSQSTDAPSQTALLAPDVPRAPVPPEVAADIEAVARDEQDVAREMELLAEESERIGAESERIGTEAEAVGDGLLPWSAEAIRASRPQKAARDAMALLEAEKNGPLQRYLALEARSVVIGGDLEQEEIADVLVQEIPELSELIQEVWPFLEARMDPADVRGLRSLGFSRGAFPWGREEVRLEIFEREDHVEVRRTRGNGHGTSQFPLPLPPEYQRLVELDRKLRSGR